MAATNGVKMGHIRERKLKGEGEADYQTGLATYYCRDNKNLKRGLYWAKQAAEQGCARGLLILANAYLKGDGVLGDPVESMKWLLLANASDHARAKEIMDQCQKEFPSTIDEALKEAKKWEKEHPEAFFNPD